MVFENPTAECDMRVGVRIRQKPRRQRDQQDINARHDEPWQRGLQIQFPFSPPNDLLGHPRPPT